MPRIARLVAIGYPHHIIQRGNNRQTVFFDEQDREFYVRLLVTYSKECGCTINAFCLMDNHVHLLVVPGRKDSLAKTMQKLSLRYTQYMNKKYNRTGRLWECRFHSCLVEKDTYLLRVCRYIERNPVRAKVVTRANQYGWSSVSANTSSASQFNFIEPIWKNYLNREAYIELLNREDDNDEINLIRRSTFSGRPLGTSSFLEHISKALGFTVKVRPRGRPSKVKK